MGKVTESSAPINADAELVGFAPRVSVVIPCRNEKGHIAACLAALCSQEPVEGDYEIIVADGESNDGTREILSEWARRNKKIRVIQNEGRIVSTGLNAAIRASRGSVIIRIDVHTRYARDYLRECVSSLQKTGATNVGGAWVARGDTLLTRAIAGAFQSKLVMGGARGHDPEYEGEVDTVYLGCWARESFDKYGGFDEQLVRNQDDELNLRITRAGGRIWQSPRIKSEYCPRGSIKSLFRQYRQYGYWKVRVIQKHRLPASFRHLVPGIYVASSLSLAPLSLVSSWAGVLLALSITSYLTANLAASVWIAQQKGWILLPLLPLVIAACQLGYGLGFVHGVLDFVVLHRKASGSQTSLTR